eukprot:CAMPEP_0202460704 /NCGR_PEP_ID=MMETSP1360-20130828/45448_1 /ASSEMBLY_ACC=CAM_ASM_000848 /TAXON_ID=515479 /ORGANISM="Licmophora paradoxa, Strain CCMP2313" /LENGTH=158 /DNA_ID=CAMNT_0049082473 /DNA_START=6 /DNA_END=482 /DNA_ORIENTATION=-
MQDHPLQFLWAYKYDSDNGSSSSSGGNGINIHADAAAVNVNLWITPDEANLDSTSGGLVVYTVKPPEDWDFQYDENVIKELLSPSNYANVTIPHRQNRAVIFESSLFHCTDRFRFKEGYENRRINLTLLYGRFQTQRRQNDNEELSSSKKSDAVNDEF